MKNAQIILLIMNCHKYKYKSNIQRETWLQKLPSYITYYHVLGKSPTIDFNTEYKIDENNHILYVNVDDVTNCVPPVYWLFPANGINALLIKLVAVDNSTATDARDSAAVPQK